MSWAEVSENSSGASDSHQALRLVFFGDSICVGQGVSIHKGWVTRIAARIDELSTELGAEIVIVNASINGNTTRQALERMPYDVQSNGVDILLVQFGMNDCNHWLTDKGMPRVSPHGFAANLEEIIERGINFGAEQVMLNTNHPTTRVEEQLPHTEATYEESNRRYNEIVREVAATLGDRVILNDVEASFDAHVRGDGARLAELLLADGLHLSERGHDLYYELIAPKVEALVRQPLSRRAAQFAP